VLEGEAGQCGGCKQFCASGISSFRLWLSLCSNGKKKSNVLKSEKSLIPRLVAEGANARVNPHRRGLISLLSQMHVVEK